MSEKEQDNALRPLRFADFAGQAKIVSNLKIFVEAAKLNFHYVELMDIMFSDVNPIPVKTAMNLIGFNAGECRLPLVPMSYSGYHDLKDCLAKYNLIGKYA